MLRIVYTFFSVHKQHWEAYRQIEVMSGDEKEGKKCGCKA
jgi:hypothetical protein